MQPLYNNNSESVVFLLILDTVIMAMLNWHLYFFLCHLKIISKFKITYVASFQFSGKQIKKTIYRRRIKDTFLTIQARDL